MPQPARSSQTKKPLTVALAGNPNSGKTTIFNGITGTRQHVGNWPGVTVEKKEGIASHRGHQIRAIDLPGTYSLTAYSMEEIVTRNYIIEERPDVVIDVVDASNLERNLYLAQQLKELDIPLILAFNVMDEAQKQGYQIDIPQLSKLLATPIIPTVGTREQGIHQLLDTVVDLAEGKRTMPHLTFHYGDEIEAELQHLEALIRQNDRLSDKYLPRWLAVKLLEEDTEIQHIVQQYEHGDEFLHQAQQSLERLETLFHDRGEALIAERRYGLVHGALNETVTLPPQIRFTTSDTVDKLLTHRALGLPIFIGVMWIAFQFVATVGGELLLQPIETVFGWFGEALRTLFVNAGAPAWLISLVVDGIVAGVGGVAVFLPVIFSLYFVIALLEGSGYMARVAFIMDKLMHSIGLHGKSFLPMLLGFGCNVPAIMGTRILENRSDRILTILINPLMSCSARLPIYAIFAAAFFPEHQGTVIFSMYFLGILLAIGMGLVFKKVFFPGKSTPFIMELPPYRIPTLKSITLHMWDRGKMFLKKMSGIILSVSIIVWFMGTFPWGVEFASVESYIGVIGKTLAPIFDPLGFGTWQAAVSFVFGLLAKEVVVSTLSILYVGGAEVAEEALANALHGVFTPLTAYAFMAFSLIYTSCVATLATIKRETNSWKWTAFSVSYQFILAWLVAFIIYQGGRLLGLQ
ncbi:ferrous iron transport protein B [candidate division KSB3 bacterium]|uniref:Ferrous iron transport protein B n=1 Tax=candidate division KSB3 bacterium TaxID=2044937 RepID=A0A9D5JUC3_9BACT|nr:ferrous iron transport protein B [candidate division KSB3 bacterium]MBD3323831.1 ferrous iron transport protein B [candidate division KSB3 bacterium]